MTEATDPCWVNRAWVVSSRRRSSRSGADSNGTYQGNSTAIDTQGPLPTRCRDQSHQEWTFLDRGKWSLCMPIGSVFHGFGAHVNPAWLSISGGIAIASAPDYPRL